jgi:hypothetical protein
MCLDAQEENKFHPSKFFPSFFFFFFNRNIIKKRKAQLGYTGNIQEKHLTRIRKNMKILKTKHQGSYKRSCPSRKSKNEK